MAPWRHAACAVAVVLSALISATITPISAQHQHVASHWHHQYGNTVRLAVIGDHGIEGPIAKAVSELVKSWNPDAVISVGDTNYPAGSNLTIDRNVGQYYGDFIAPYKGTYGNGSQTGNRFWPCPGNHDIGPKGPNSPEVLSAYLSYMPVQRHRFYDVHLGPVHLFSLDSDSTIARHDASSKNVPGAHHISEVVWLHRRMTWSEAAWKLVVCHHPPYSSGAHGSSQRMRWPFREWGAVAVLSGHDHSYERVLTPPNGFPYYVNGVGGAHLYGFKAPYVQGSAVRYTSTTGKGGGGAQLIEANATHFTVKFYSTLNPSVALDCYRAIREPAGRAPPASAGGAAARGAGQTAGAVRYVDCTGEGVAAPPGTTYEVTRMTFPQATPTAAASWPGATDGSDSGGGGGGGVPIPSPPPPADGAAGEGGGTGTVPPPPSLQAPAADSGSTPPVGSGSEGAGGNVSSTPTPGVPPSGSTPDSGPGGSTVAGAGGIGGPGDGGGGGGGSAGVQEVPTNTAHVPGVEDEYADNWVTGE